MNLIRTILAVLCMAFVSTGQAQDMDKALTEVATKLADLTKENGKKKVTVLDFTDLQGGSSELGKYVAEQLTVNLVMVKKDFAVLDRANLRKIMAEHKLTAAGLIDPENAKKLGRFSGLDALILGTIVPKGQTMNLTAKIITTDTAEIVAAAKAEFRSDDTVQRLLSQPAAEGSTDYAATPKKVPTIVKTFDDVRFELQPLRITQGKYYLLTLNVTNLNPARTVCISLDHNNGILGFPLKSAINDPEGYEFQADSYNVRGLEVGSWWQYNGYSGGVTRIKPKESVSATIQFYTHPGRVASSGNCRLQLAFYSLQVDG